MLNDNKFDAVVIGSGPNGLAAAITLAQAGLSVAIYEAKETIGGGMRSSDLTLPGFIHDICSAVHPLGIGSPFFAHLPLEDFGLEWIQPKSPLAHPFDNEPPAILDQSIESTCFSLGLDGPAYKRLIEPLVVNWDIIADQILGPFKLPKHPILMARFGFLAIQSAEGFARRYFKLERSHGLFAGLAAHSILPLNKLATAAFGLVLGILSHTKGWPVAFGGSQRIADALASYFQAIGGTIFTNTNVESIDCFSSSKVILCDITPKQLLKISGHQLPEHYKKSLCSYRYGPGVFKIDWALSSPIPWKSRECLRAGTVHIGGTLKEIAASEAEVWQGKHPERPFIILSQPSLFDTTRAPPSRHTAWGYCHVPNRSLMDMTARIEEQIERFAPGFKDCILARSTMNTHDLERYNPNYIGGDIGGGVQDIYQLFTRPVPRIVPYSTPVKGLYLCSSSTPPGGGVHGMCGYHAAKAALEYIRSLY